MSLFALFSPLVDYCLYIECSTVNPMPWKIELKYTKSTQELLTVCGWPTDPYDLCICSDINDVMKRHN